VFDAAQEADRLVDSLGDIVVLYPDDADLARTTLRVVTNVGELSRTWRKL
jgi:hypothetical protein